MSIKWSNINTFKNNYGLIFILNNYSHFHSVHENDQNTNKLDWFIDTNSYKGIDTKYA